MEKVERIRQLVAEWKCGCANATPGSPEECPVCTRALIDAIEGVVGVVTPPRGCGRPLADGQWWKFCGETDMGQGAPALCAECGGNLKPATPAAS